MVKKKAHINSFSDAGSVIVSPETVSVTEWYTITINPETQLFGDPDRFMLVSSYVYGKLKNINHIECYLYPEISGKGRIHFHGKIKIIDVIDFYLYGVYKLMLIGHIEIDTIKDVKVWDTYMTKSCPMMASLCRSTPTNVYLSEVLSKRLHAQEYRMHIFDTIGAG